MDMNAHRFIEGFLTPEECAGMRARLDGLGWEPAIVRFDAGARADARVRDSDRVEFVDDILASEMWARLRARMELSDIASMCAEAWDPLGFRGWFRGYRYSPGQKFAKHRDGREREGESAITRITALVYLSDAPSGDGATILHPERADPSPPVRILPKEGALLLFASSHLHEGEPPSAGTKLVLRTDILFPFAG